MTPTDLNTQTLRKKLAEAEAAYADAWAVWTGRAAAVQWPEHRSRTKGGAA